LREIALNLAMACLLFLGAYGWSPARSCVLSKGPLVPRLRTWPVRVWFSEDAEFVDSLANGKW